MRSKKLLRSLLTGVRRLLASVVSYAAALADAHPMVFIVSSHTENRYEQGAQSQRS
jgi:hypothetical protein